MKQRQLRHFLFSSFLFLGLGAIAAPLTFEERVEEAREFVQDKEWPQAIAAYERLAKETAGSPKGDAFAVELANIHFSSGSLTKTVEACNRFLSSRKGSPYTTQVLHLKAFALWSQGLFEESYNVFSNRTWEELRALPEKVRPRVYDVIARALKGMDRGIDGRVVRAEAAGVMKSGGKPILSGKVSTTFDKLDTDADWEAFLKQVPASIRTRITTKKELPKKEKKLRWGYFVFGLAGDFGTVSTTTTNYRQLFLLGHLEVDFLQSHSGSNLAFYTQYSLLPLSKGPAGETLGWWNTGLLFDARMIGGGEPGLSFSVNLGLFYRMSQANPTQPRLNYAIGLDVYPSFRYEFPNSSSIGWYAKISPYFQSMQRINLSDNITGGGMDYLFTAVPERLWIRVFAEAERLKHTLDDGTVFENTQIRFGARAMF